MRREERTLHAAPAGGTRFPLAATLCGSLVVFVVLAVVALKLTPDLFASDGPEWFDSGTRCARTQDVEAVTNCLRADEARASSRRGVTTATLALFAGALSAFGAFYTARNFRQHRDEIAQRHDLDQEAHALDRETHNREQDRLITERFTRAIDQLGERDKLDVRLGGIYALERIAKESDKDHPQIVEVLTAYVRGQVPWRWTPPSDEPPDAPDLPSDVQAAMSVLGRRISSQDRQGLELNLANTDLRRLILRQDETSFCKANLQGANLDLASLRGVDFRHAHLLLTSLREADLTEADLRDAVLTSADVRGAYMIQADLRGATLRTGFSGVRLYGADLRGDLEGINLKGASYDSLTKWPTGFNPDVHGADLVHEVDYSQFV